MVTQITKCKLANGKLIWCAVVAELKPLNSRVKTLTMDDGKEFADHQAIDQKLGIQTNYVDPYFSSQRDSNENFNGLLSKYILGNVPPVQYMSREFNGGSLCL